MPKKCSGLCKMRITLYIVSFICNFYYFGNIIMIFCNMNRNNNVNKC